MNATQIVAYMFDADLYHPKCLVDGFVKAGRLSPGAWGMGPEDALDQLAEYEQLNRHDESTFDSGEFPKVVFADQVNECEDDTCGSWHEPLI